MIYEWLRPLSGHPYISYLSCGENFLNFVRSKCKDREGNLILRLKLFWTKVRSILATHYLNLASFQIYILKVTYHFHLLNFACFRCQRNAVVMGEGRLLW